MRQFLILLVVTCMNLPVCTAQLPGHFIRSYGSIGTDGGVSVCHDQSGNIFATGFFSGYMMADSSHYLYGSGGSDMYLIRNDPDGNLVWAVQAGGTGFDRPTDVACDPSGNIFITGFFSGTATFGNQSVTSSGLRDFYIAKYNPAGNLDWIRTGGGAMHDQGNRLSVDAAGNCVVTGEFAGNATFGSNLMTSQQDPVTGNYSIDLFIARYSPSGNLVWIKKGSSGFTDRGTGIATDATGSIYLAGRFSDTISFSSVYPNTMYNACFIMKLDGFGNEIWFRKIGGGMFNIIEDIGVTPSGNPVITGYFRGSPYIDVIPVVSIQTTHDYGVFLVQLDGNGAPIWVKTFGSSCEVDSRSLAIDDSSHIYIAGIYKCRLDDFSSVYGAGAFNSVGFHDVYVARFNPSGDFEWARNYGGQLEDRLSDIAVNQHGQPLITGNYEDRMMFPVIHDASFNLLNYGNIGLQTPYIEQYCNEPQDWKMFQVKSNGQSDAFLARPAHPSVQPYYYYYNLGDTVCARPFVKVEISMTSSDDRAPDNPILESCTDRKLVANSNTSRIIHFNQQATASPGPRFTYLWSTGSTDREIQPSQSGVYWVRMTSIDSCFVSSDTVTYTRHALPQRPLLSDSQGINVLADTTLTVQLCRPDSLTITAQTNSSYQVFWFTNPVINDSLNITIHPGNNYLTTFSNISNMHAYTCWVIDSNGCQNNNLIRVEIDSALHVIQPRLTFFNPVSHTPVTGDTIRYCDANSFGLIAGIYDTLVGLPPGHGNCFNQYFVPYASYNWNINQPANVMTSSCGQTVYYDVSMAGWYTVTCTMTRQNPCGIADTFFFEKDVFLVVDPVPSITASITGDTLMCPGDTIVLSGSGGPYFHWYLYNPQVFLSAQQRQDYHNNTTSE